MKFLIMLCFVLFISGCSTNTDLILKDPYPKLRDLSVIIKKVGDSEKKTIETLEQILNDYDVSVAAAPVIGEQKRIIVIKEKEKTEVFINPKIIKSDGSVKGIEKSIVIPGVHAIINRSKKIKVEYQDLNLKVKSKSFEGQLSKEIQQNIDLLNGVLIYDVADDIFYKE